MIPPTSTKSIAVPRACRLRSARRRFAYVVVIAFALFLGIEAALRGAAALKVGPRALLYGTPLAGRALKPEKLGERPWHKQIARAESNQVQIGTSDAGYLKYGPYQKKLGYDEHGVQYQVGINASGFRGKDFTAKTKGVVRVVALGASSTFGYHDRDDETWPHYLEQELNGRHSQEPVEGVTAFEVLNLGIPHLDSENLLALYAAEGLPLEPDVVVFYEGVNDTRDLDPSTAEEWLHAVSQRLVLALFAYRVATPWFTSFDAEDVAAARAGKLDQFLRTLDRIRRLCRERSIRFIVVSQQAQSETLPREKLGAVTYAEEVAQVRARLARGESISLQALQFLLHTELMEGLAGWARSSGVEYADGIAALDRAGERDQLLSWVHLSPAGNRVLAGAIAETVWSGRERR